MTTAHRATWKAARGGLQEEGSFRLHVPSAAVSSKDAPTELNLKSRPSTDPSRDDLRARLDISEQPLPKRPRKTRFGPLDPAIQEPPPSSPKPLLNINETLSADLQPSDSDASEADSDDDDDEADLLAELENIRREREYDRAKKQAEEQEQEEQQNIARAAVGNPLVRPFTPLRAEISDTASIATGSVPAFAVRRRWNDDVIFRSEATSDRATKQRFINDTIRNDFHRKFMKRHVK